MSRLDLAELWTTRRARLWLLAAAVAAWLPALGVGFRGWLDFSAFYAAGRFAFTPDVSRLEPIVRFQAEHALPITPFVYPAGVALAYVPLAQLSYPLAAAIHLIAMLAALVAAAILGADLVGLPRRWAVLAALAWAPAAAGVVSGQNTSLALLLVVLATRAILGSERRASHPAGSTGRPGAGRASASVAGALVGLLAYKPQLAAPLYGLLLLRSRWLALAVAAGFVGIHYVTGVIAAGGNLAWPLDWMATVQAYTVEDFRANGWQAVSLPALMTRIEVAAGAMTPFGPLTLGGYLVGGIIVVAALPALRSRPAVESVALACSVGLAVNPHAWVYDATLLLPGLAVFGRSAAARGWPAADRWLFAGAYALAVSWPVGGLVGFVPLAVVVVAAPIVLMLRRPSESPGQRALARPMGTDRAGAV